MFPKNSYTVNKTQKDVGEHKKKELEDIAAETLRQVIDNMDGNVEMETISDFEKKQFNDKIYKTLNELLLDSSLHLSQGEKQKVIEYVSNEMFGFGPINCLIHDPNVTEIMVNGNNKVYVEKSGKIHKTDVNFRDNDHVLHIINKIINPLGRRIDESSPTVDARLPDGSRVNAIIPPLSINGPSLTIRKFSTDPFKTEDLINFGSITRDMVDFLEACVRTRLNIIVSGGTGSGKTSTLNVLSSFIPEEERIVTIEDTAELQLRQDHVITLESRPANIEGRGEYTIRELVRNCLRMRPDRIVVGEVRGGETLDMLQAMNTGHDGSISTLHANSPRDALVRLETMVLMAGMELPLRAIREQIASSVNIIVQQARMSDGSRKIIKISELVGMEGDNIKTQDIFSYEQEGTNKEGRVLGKHKATGVIPLCLDKILLRGEEFRIDRIPEWVAYQKDIERQKQEKLEQAKLEQEKSYEDSTDDEFNSFSEIEFLSEEKEKNKAGNSIPNIDISCSGPDLAETGDTVTFTIIVTNKSENIDLSDCVVTCSRPNITRNTGFLPAGEEFTYQLNYKIQPEDHPFIENKVIAVTSDPDCYEVEVSDKHVLAVMKPQIHTSCVGPSKGHIGEVIQYCIIVNNTSENVDLLDVVITDSSQNWTKIINFLPAGTTETFEASYTISEKDYPAIETHISVSGVNRFGEGVRVQALYSSSVERAPEEILPQKIDEYSNSSEDQGYEEHPPEDKELVEIPESKPQYQNEESNIELTAYLVQGENEDDKEIISEDITTALEIVKEKDYNSSNAASKRPVVHGLQIFSLPNTVKESDSSYEHSASKAKENNESPQETVAEPSLIKEEKAKTLHSHLVYEDFRKNGLSLVDSIEVTGMHSVTGNIREDVSGGDFSDITLEEPVNSILQNINDDELVVTEEFPANLYEETVSPSSEEESTEALAPSSEEESTEALAPSSEEESTEALAPSLEESKPEIDSNNKHASNKRFLIPEGMRGIPVSISNPEYLAECLDSGDRVDVLVIYTEERFNRELSASIIAENALIISWLEEKISGIAETVKSKMALIAVTPVEAEKLVYANLKGTIHLIIR